MKFAPACVPPPDDDDLPNKFPPEDEGVGFWAKRLPPPTTADVLPVAPPKRLAPPPALGLCSVFPNRDPPEGTANEPLLPALEDVVDGFPNKLPPKDDEGAPPAAGKENPPPEGAALALLPNKLPPEDALALAARAGVPPNILPPELVFMFPNKLPAVAPVFAVGLFELAVLLVFELGVLPNMLLPPLLPDKGKLELEPPLVAPAPPKGPKPPMLLVLGLVLVLLPPKSEAVPLEDDDDG